MLAFSRNTAFVSKNATFGTNYAPGVQASLRDAGQIVTTAGDKSPGYFQMSLRDAWEGAPNKELLRLTRGNPKR
jgi:hypothetical protein